MNGLPMPPVKLPASPAPSAGLPPLPVAPVQAAPTRPPPPPPPERKAEPTRLPTIALQPKPEPEKSAVSLDTARRAQAVFAGEARAREKHEDRPASGGRSPAEARWGKA